MVSLAAINPFNPSNVSVPRDKKQAKNFCNQKQKIIRQTTLTMEHKTEAEQPEQRQEFTDLEEVPVDLATLAKVTVEKDGEGNWTKETMIGIQTAISNVFMHKFPTFLEHYRSILRKNIGNVEDYYKAYNDLNIKVRDKSMAITNEILQVNNLTYEEYTKNLHYWVKNGDPSMWRGIGQVLCSRGAIKSHNDITREQVVEAIKFQIESLQAEFDNCKNFLPHKSLVPQFAFLRVSDLLAIKFGIEAEDLNSEIQKEHLEKDEDIIELNRKYKQVRDQCIAKLQEQPSENHPPAQPVDKPQEQTSPKEEGEKAPSPKEEAVKEPSPKEEAVKEPSPKESAVKEPKEEAVKEHSPKEEAVKEPSPKETEEVNEEQEKDMERRAGDVSKENPEGEAVENAPEENHE